MLSNKKWFNNYVLLRTSLILLVVIFGLFKAFPHFLPNYEQFWVIGLSILVPLLLTILLFDYLQKPSFIQLIKEEKGLILKLYQPDARYFFYLRESHIKTLIISSEDEFTYRIYKHALSALNQIEFFINKKGSIIKTNKINIGWISEKQLNELNKIVTKQNRKTNFK